MYKNLNFSVQIVSGSQTIYSDHKGSYSMSEQKKNILLTLPDLVEGKVEKRPSKTCKTPYVADVQYEGKEYMGYTPALGCCGLCDKEAIIMMSPLLTKNPSVITLYTYPR